MFSALIHHFCTSLSQLWSLLFFLLLPYKPYKSKKKKRCYTWQTTAWMGGCQTMMLTWPRNLTSSDYISHDTPVMLSGNPVHSALCPSFWLGHHPGVVGARHDSPTGRSFYVFSCFQNPTDASIYAPYFFWIIYKNTAPGPDYLVARAPRNLCD